jgi:hypothetical protein
MITIFCDFCQFFAKIFGENIFKNHNIGRSLVIVCLRGFVSWATRKSVGLSYTVRHILVNSCLTARDVIRHATQKNRINPVFVL